MCYYLHGALYGKVDKEQFEEIYARYDCHFRMGTKHDVKLSVLDGSVNCRIYDGICDCGTAIGSNDAEDAELEQFERIFNEFKNLQGAKHIYLCKTWDGKTNKKEKNVKIDSINVKEFLANAEPNILYTVEL